MVTIEQKIELFSKLIYQEVQNEIEDKTNQFNEKQTSLLEKVQAEAKMKALDIQKASHKKLNQKKNEIITLSKIENRKEIIEAKEACMSQMMTKIEEKAKIFVTTQDYQGYIEKTLEQGIKLMGTQNPLEVFVTKEDIERFKPLLNKGNLFISRAQSNIIGGLIMEDAKTHTRVDFSIRTRLNEMKPFIINKVMEALEEVGDQIES